ncbi:MAG TPA: hypothetical protein VJ578_07035, partial [Dehalococcoidia bacterium]|nr:hypothetical protein [Dehalococcoidia bacterium]
MIHSVRWRLFLSFLLVIVVAVGAVAIFVSRTASSEVQQYETRTYDVRIGRVGTLLARYYLERQGWAGVGPVIDQIGQLYNQRLVLVDPQGLVVADSEGMIEVGEEPEFEPHEAIPIIAGQIRFGAVAVMPQMSAPPPGGGPAPTEDASVSDLSSSINRYLLWGGLLAVAVAALVTLFMSRRILSPAESLAQAARALSRGDFSQ